MHIRMRLCAYVHTCSHIGTRPTCFYLLPMVSFCEFTLPAHVFRACSLTLPCSSASELLSPYVRQHHCGVLHSSPGFFEVGPTFVPHLFLSGVCLLHTIVLVTRNLSSVLNVLEDQGSQSSTVCTEWSLDPQTFRWISSLAGPFQVDLFATRDNRRLRSFVSPFLAPLACGTNAFSHQWGSVFLFSTRASPYGSCRQALQVSCRWALVAPRPLSPVGLVSEPSLRVQGSVSSSFSQLTLGGRTFHSLPSVYRLHVWLL